MTEYKQSNEIKNYLKNKKRKRKRKKVVMLTVVITVGLILFLTKAPIFNVNKIDVLGTSKINADNLRENLKAFIGENIYTVNESEIKNKLMQDKYVREVKISRKGFSKLVIDIVEESPVFYINNNGIIEVINENLVVIEELDSIQGRNLVEISGVSFENISLGEKISDDEMLSGILTKFYPYISQNKESIKFDQINVSDIVNIKGKIGSVEVFFGDDNDLHNKMENVYRILLSEEIKLTKGYIDVSFDGPPIIKKISN